jgi:lipoprotein-anchoring transpeptidase ErfK/SrfK
MGRIGRTIMMNRRIAALGLPWFLAGCTGSRLDLGQSLGLDIGSGIYGAVEGEPFPVPAIDLRRINPNFLRREVAYHSDERPGTVIVDPSARYAFVVEGEGRAIRYGVGVGRTEAFNFRGTALIGRKSKWPDWTPTAAMIAREPARYGPYAGGLAGGLNNPLGPRALYLYSHGVDTHYRLHGTIQPWTIGTMVSSGCIRFINQDIIDLYDRVPVGSRVIVLPAGESVAAG